MISIGYQALILFSLLSSTVAGDWQLFKDASEFLSGSSHQLKNEASINSDPKINRNHWAVLVAGSNGWANYRHQADICHAYQILKKGGLKDENIVVFMYDDIAFNPYNPRPGVIINHPNGDNVYHGVPKDYTGRDCTVDNFFAVVHGNKSAISGGSGKVVNSGPNDHIFIYYADHGAPGLVMMPNGVLYAKDLIETLKKKHAANSYKRMVFYLEACESGSMFDGILPGNIGIYAVSAANPHENSFAYYCPGQSPGPPQEYHTCLGDLFSISWMEDSDLHDSSKETLAKQYRVVRNRTFTRHFLNRTCHVMRYGDLKMSKDLLALYMGRKSANDSLSLTEHSKGNVVPQRDADLLHFTYKYNKAPEGSTEKKEAQDELMSLIANRAHVDATVEEVVKTMFGESKLDSFQNFVRPRGHPLVDDWDCLKYMVEGYEKYCGPLGRYGRRYTRAMANMCNAGATAMEMAEVAATVCSKLTLAAANSDSGDLPIEIENLNGT